MLNIFFRFCSLLVDEIKKSLDQTVLEEFTNLPTKKIVLSEEEQAVLKIMRNCESAKVDVKKIVEKHAVCSHGFCSQGFQQQIWSTNYIRNLDPNNVNTLFLEQNNNNKHKCKTKYKK